MSMETNLPVLESLLWRGPKAAPAHTKPSINICWVNECIQYSASPFHLYPIRLSHSQKGNYLIGYVFQFSRSMILNPGCMFEAPGELLKNTYV